MIYFQVKKGSRSLFNPALWGCQIVLILLGNVLLSAQPAFAQGKNNIGFVQQDLNGDGRPDLAIIKVKIVSDNDQIYVYDGGQDMKWIDNLNSIVDFNNDTWVFDIGGDGNAQLIIKFSESISQKMADIYVDQNSDLLVSYQMNDGDVQVTETNHPPLKVIVDGSWFYENGEINWNTTFVTDGSAVQLVNIFDLSDDYYKWVKLDGSPDFELEFRDDNVDSIPEYGIWRFLSSSPLQDSLVRTWIWSNEGKHRPKQPENYVFWPYLDNRDSGSNYFDSIPHIEMDWLQARILRVRLQGYPIEKGYHINTTQYFNKTEDNYADFENPQAYYDLALDNDGYPELHIRQIYQKAGDSYRDNLPVPVNEIRWSWNQFNETGLTWDYKLGLAGRHKITSTVDFADFRVISIPYEDLPSWVIENSWDYATFVAKENAQVLSSEGIYSWGPVETINSQFEFKGFDYLAGWIDQDISGAFQNLPVGLRGDFAPTLNNQPYLYFSPIDRKLHLLEAKHGIWNIDGISIIKFANLDDDDFLDSWFLYLGNDLQQEIHLTNNFIIYADKSNIEITETEITPSQFTTLPPHNHKEWSELKQKLESQQSNFDPHNLAGSVNNFEGSQLKISSGTIRDFRFIDKGFRFVMAIQSDFEISGKDMLGLDSLDAGNFLVSYTGTFQIEPLTPPLLSIRFISPPNQRMKIDNPVGITAITSNDGLEDATSLRLILEASQSHEFVELSRERLDVLAGIPSHFSYSWQPRKSGIWDLRLRLEDEDGRTLALDDQSVQVGTGTETGIPEIIWISSDNLWHIPAVLVLLMFAISISFLFRSVLHTSSSNPG